MHDMQIMSSSSSKKGPGPGLDGRGNPEALEQAGHGQGWAQSVEMGQNATNSRQAPTPRNRVRNLGFHKCKCINVVAPVINENTFFFLQMQFISQ